MLSTLLTNGPLQAGVVVDQFMLLNQHVRDLDAVWIAAPASSEKVRLRRLESSPAEEMNIHRTLRTFAVTKSSCTNNACVQES